MNGRWVKGVTLATACLIGGELRLAAQDKVAQGAELFASQKCVMCHAVAGKGNAKGALDGVGKKLKEADLRAWLGADDGPDAQTAQLNRAEHAMQPRFALELVMEHRERLLQERLVGQRILLVGS